MNSWFNGCIMSDLQKFQQFFDELDIEYKVLNNKILIGDNDIIKEKGSYGKSLEIAFSDIGKFLGFEPWGE